MDTLRHAPVYTGSQRTRIRASDLATPPRTGGGTEDRIDATLLIALFVLLVVVLPVLAVVASARIRRLEIARRSPASKPLRFEAEARLAALERKLARVESRLQALEGHSAAETPAEASLPEPISSAEPLAAPQSFSEAPPPEFPASATPPIAPPRPDWEAVVGSRWLVYFGFIALLFALAFSIKYSFDNRWVGPLGRVIVGLLVGSLLLLWTDHLLHKGFLYFSEFIAALGAAVLYFSLWGAWRYFSLLPWTATLAAMILVTAVMMVIALARHSQRLVLVALAGGYLTPFLLHTAHDPLLSLFTYLLFLSGTALGLERAQRWPWLPLAALLAMESTYWTWFFAFYQPPSLASSLLFATLLFLCFSVMPALRGLESSRLTFTDYLVAGANLVAYLVALRELLWPAHRWLLLAFYLGLAAAHLRLLRSLPRPLPNQSRAMRRFYAAASLICLSLAFPARLDHAWLTISWALLGAALVWSGLRSPSPPLRSFGALLIAIVCVRLLFLSLPAPRLLWNPRFAAFAVVVACLAFLTVLGARAAARLEESERRSLGVIVVAVNFYSLLAMSLEIWDFLGRTHAPGLGNWPAQQMGLSILWTLYAAGLVLFGMARKSALLRWLALALFAMVVAKVFVYDMASLERLYRILSFLVLGLLLLAVSVLYRRRSEQKARREASTPP